MPFQSVIDTGCTVCAGTCTFPNAACAHDGNGCGFSGVSVLFSLAGPDAAAVTFPRFFGTA